MMLEVAHPAANPRTAVVRTGNLFDPRKRLGWRPSPIRFAQRRHPRQAGDRIDEELENIAASIESGIANPPERFLSPA